MYDKIEETERLLIDAKAKKKTIEEDKLTGDNIYRVLMCFSKLYNVMNDEERRDLMQALIDEIHIHEEPQENGQWLKGIEFRLPVIGEDVFDCLDIHTALSVWHYCPNSIPRNISTLIWSWMNWTSPVQRARLLIRRSRTMCWSTAA